MQRPGRGKAQLAGWLGAMWLALGPLQAAAYEQSPEVSRFVDEMSQDYGFAGEQLNALFGDVERKQSILDAISRPAEKSKPWRDYRPLFLTESRIGQGVDFWRQHEAALQRAEQTYGVPAQIIVAIIGVETFYGRNTGSYRVADALSTLCFDYPPRATFFCDQLRQFLLLVREEQIDALSLKGSYAGAMGLPQFMPGSFRAYAVDFDGDGHIDIWNDPEDAIGSVASYFKQHGWVAGGAVVSRAKVSAADPAQGLSPGLDPSHTLAQLQALGWSVDDAIDPQVPLTSLVLDGVDGPEYWIGQPNFFTITRYNRSAMYAMAVYQLSQELLKARGQS